MYHEGMRELQDRYGGRPVADAIEKHRKHLEFTEEDKQFIEALPFFFLDADVVFEITNSRIRMTQDAEGNWTGVLGGGLPTQALQDLAYNTGIGEEVEQLLDSLLGLVADLNPDENGECQDISVTLEFEAVPAFWFNASDY